MNSQVAEVSTKYLVEAAKNAVPTGYKQTEVGVIPEDWEVRTLEQLVAFRNGAAHENCIDDSGDYVVVNSKFISTEGLTRKGSKECRQPAYQSELLMVMSDVPNGRAIAKCYFVEANDTYTVNQRICALKCTGIEAGFLFYKLNRNSFYLAFDDGAKQTNLRRQDVLDCPIPVPQKAEQTAIANALSDVDALISELEKLIAKKQAIKTATMQQLLTGRTRLPQFALREDGTLKATKPSELGEIPEDWEIIRVKEVTSDHKQGFYTKDSYTNDGTRLARITDLNNPSVDFDSMPRLKITESDYKQYKVRVGDVLIARSGAIGRYGIITKPIKAIFASYIIRFSFSQSKMINDYFGYVYQSEETQEQLLSITQGSSNININAENIKSLKIKLPSIEEQTAIATILSDMDTEIQALEQRLGKTRQIKQGMMQELLTGKTRLINPSKEVIHE
ncbi:MAG: restriction endonuclease subunit S [Vibrio ordalii]|uniref:restriction endonuclease subunit S n=1 Tax=Vibrio ordalii TaxID=28174 RepID=UPI003F2D4991